MAPTPLLASIWTLGLNQLMSKSSQELVNSSPINVDAEMSLQLKKVFRDVDVNGDDKLDLNEITRLLGKLNLNLSRSGVKSAFKVSFVVFTDVCRLDIFYRSLPLHFES